MPKFANDTNRDGTHVRIDQVRIDHVRIDKWLWAARFFKTRSLAAQAVDGGQVRLNGERAKPARDLKPGDELVIRIGAFEWVIEVRALSARRGPASEAQQLYEESETSRQRRSEAVAARKLAAGSVRHAKGRPTKRDRRQLRRLKSGE